MKYKKRRFVPGEGMHVYQRSVYGQMIFYDLEDFLVYYMIFSVYARMYGVKIMEMCMMPNHTHTLLVSDEIEKISSFMRHYSSVFVREYNDDVGRRGPLFHKSFGSAPKKGAKSIRSTIVYIGNNPVEKGLSQTADGYRWNFLTYMKRKLAGHSIPHRALNGKLQRAFKYVSSACSRSRYLNYEQLRKLMRDLPKSDIEILTDHIIMTYFPFDVDALLSFYQSYEDMIHAMHSTSGNEYDIREEYTSDPDTVYRKMISVLKAKGIIGEGEQVRKITMLPTDEKYKIAHLLRCETDAHLNQIARFLHMPVLKL